MIDQQTLLYKQQEVSLERNLDILLALKKFTDNHQLWHKKDLSRCEANAHRLQAQLMFQPYQLGEWFVGSVKMPAVGFTPQVYTKEGGFGYYCEVGRVEELAYEQSEGVRLIAKEIIEYWNDKSSISLTRAKYPKRLQEALPSDNWIGDSGIAFPLYRMAGAQLDFSKLLRLGIGGLQKEITSRLQAVDSEQQTQFIKGMTAALDILKEVCLRYIASLRRLPFPPKEVKKISLLQRSLQHIASEPPSNFHEACQLTWLYVLISGAQNYGRMDDYLGPFYMNDLKKGALSQATALEYLSSLWQLMDERKTVYDGRVIIGGKGRVDEEAANQLALVILEVAKRKRTTLPQLTLRFYKGQAEDLWEKGMEVLGTGYVYPMLYNDEVNISSVQNAFGVSAEEAQHYTPFGCGEYILNHRSFGTPSGVINLAKTLEVTLFKGFDPITEQKAGMPNPLKDFKTFEDLKDTFQKQLAYHIEALALQERIEYESAAETAPFLYYSLLYDDCLSQIKPIFEGGVRYLGGTLEAYGNVNATDGLLAIKQLVFNTGQYSLDQFREALLANFDGFEVLQDAILEVAKYGNDQEDADQMLCDIHDFLCDTTQVQANKVGLNSYLIVNINNDANTDLGKFTLASADGRKAGEPLNNGNAPYQGRDTAGITALLNSLVKPRTDIHAGAVQNLKLSREWFGKYPEKLQVLLKSYFAAGGAQLMLTIVDRQALENAMIEPEKYANLIVRVGGFSARFTELRRETQLEIIQRTFY